MNELNVLPRNFFRLIFVREEMSHFCFHLLVLLLTLYPAASAAQLKVMTFNVLWFGSQVDDGIEKIAKHIKLISPDIVGLQVSSMELIY
jgi:hypothetical protein